MFDGKESRVFQPREYVKYIEFIRFRDSSSFDIELELDPPIKLGVCKGEGIVKDTFWATVEAIEYIKKLKS